MISETREVQTIVYISLIISIMIVVVLITVGIFQNDEIDSYLLCSTAIVAVTGNIGKVDRLDTFLEALSLYSCLVLYGIILFEACFGGMEFDDFEGRFVKGLSFVFFALSIVIPLLEINEKKRNEKKMA